jgi:hypothetical protein
LSSHQFTFSILSPMASARSFKLDSTNSIS